MPFWMDWGAAGAPNGEWSASSGSSGWGPERSRAVVLVRAGEGKCDVEWERRRVWAPAEGLEEGRVWSVV